MSELAACPRKGKEGVGRQLEQRGEFRKSSRIGGRGVQKRVKGGGAGTLSVREVGGKRNRRA